MGRLWLVIDPSHTVTLVYTLVNYVAFIALLLITSLVRKNVVIDKKDISKRIYCILKPIKDKFKLIIRYFKHKKDNK